MVVPSISPFLNLTIIIEWKRHGNFWWTLGSNIQTLNQVAFKTLWTNSKIWGSLINYNSILRMKLIQKNKLDLQTANSEKSNFDIKMSKKILSWYFVSGWSLKHFLKNLWLVIKKMKGFGGHRFLLMKKNFRN